MGLGKGNLHPFLVLGQAHGTPSLAPTSVESPPAHESWQGGSTNATEKTSESRSMNR
jgi:hypothetical protein